MRISFIYMASGFGSRFGSNKLLVPFKGKALYRHGLDCICRAAGELEKEGYQTEVLVVSQYEEILEQAESQGLRAVLNRFSGQGITASLRLGTDSASPESEALPPAVYEYPHPEGIHTWFPAVREGHGLCVPSGKAGESGHIRQRLQGRTDGASRRQGRKRNHEGAPGGCVDHGGAGGRT